MSYETEKSCLLAPKESPYGCLTANEKYEIPGMGEDRYCIRSYNKLCTVYTV